MAVEENILNKAKTKKPWISVLLNQIFPGIGYFYVKAKIKGCIFTLASIAFYLIFFLSVKKILSIEIKDTTSSFIGLAFFEFIWRLLISIDCYRVVKSYNRLHGYAPKKGCLTNLVIATILVFFFPGPNFLTAIFIRTYFFQVYLIPNTNMVPTLKPADKIIVDKTVYKKALPQRADVVVFMPPHDRRKAFVKRIIGLPNEILEIKDGNIYINDAKISDKRIARNHYYNSGSYGKENEKIHIPAGNYFLMGDNSINSYDSRYFGFVPLKDIESKVIKIFYPPEKAGRIE